MVDSGICVFACQSGRVSASNSLRDGASGTVARDNLNSLNTGGRVDGKTQFPIFRGDTVDINNSPEMVRPAFP